MARIKRRSGGRIWYAWVPQQEGGTKLVSTNCTDRVAAEKRAAQLERDALDPASAAANKTTTTEACDAFVMSRQRAGRSKGTMHHYKIKLGHVARMVDDRKFPAMLRDVQTSASIERYIDARDAEGAARTTIKKELRAIAAMLRHAKRRGLWLGEVDRVMPEYEDDYQPRKRALTPWELVGLVNALSTRRAAHVVFIVATGARWGESLRAQRNDIRDGIVHLRGTKTAAAKRDVPIVPIFAAALRWALEHAEGETRLFSKWGNVRRDLGEACKAIGIEPVTPNDLRRTFSSWLRAGGVDPNHIAAAMGHTTSRMVERVYGRISADDLGRQITARLMLGAGDKPEVQEASETPAEPPKPPKNSCPGTESNRRHGDFQSFGTPREHPKDSQNVGLPARLMLGWSNRGPLFLEATASLALLLAGVQ